MEFTFKHPLKSKPAMTMVDIFLSSIILAEMKDQVSSLHHGAQTFE